MSVNMQNIVNVRGENLYLDKVLSVPPLSKFTGSYQYVNYTKLIKDGTTDMKSLEGFSDIGRKNCELYGRDIAIYELARALRDERWRFAQYKSSFEDLQQRCTQLEVRASDSEAKFQATAAKLCLVEKQCMQHQAVAQAMESATADIAELKQALQIAQATVVTMSSEKQQLKFKQEQLESDVDELTKRLALQQVDHCTELKELCKAHESKVATMFKKIETMLKLMSPETEDES